MAGLTGNLPPRDKRKMLCRNQHKNQHNLRVDLLNRVVKILVDLMILNLGSRILQNLFGGNISPFNAFSNYYYELLINYYCYYY